MKTKPDLRAWLLILAMLQFCTVSTAQNSFPLLSSGDWSNPGGDFTGITNPQLKLVGQVPNGYPRVVHLSVGTTISTVYNYEHGKDVFWGQPWDAGRYVFRGRNMVFEGSILGSGDYSDGVGDYTNIARPTLRFDVPNDYPRIVYLSGVSSISTVYNYEDGKNVFWGEPADQGLYLFRGRSVVIANNTPSGPTSEKPLVDGGVRAEEVKVEVVDAPDYVFEEDYDLRTLEETRSYIEEHKHLPEIPPAVEMEADGIGLADMNMRLLKKIEELTLYVIEQNSQNQAQQMKIEALEQRLKELEER